MLRGKQAARASGYTRFGQSFSGQTGPLLFQTSVDPFLNPMGGTAHHFPRRSLQRLQQRELLEPEPSLQAPGAFGEFQAVGDPRVMQFALRYEF